MIYKLVSSANNRIEPLIRLIMSLVKMRKRRVPRIDPCGTPAKTSTYLENLPLRITRCLSPEI